MSRRFSLKLALLTVALALPALAQAAPDIEVGFSPEGSARQFIAHWQSRWDQGVAYAG
ncbi:hypothetical protein [Raoultella lignicola]|uniref:Uncharacterized protein n=1 Tax=Raoultella lignicola TaxID=3040939 RepID=A0ABU9FDJ5_9ENTR